MYQHYLEDDGMDPGLGDLAYDGSEYQLDEFGERIGADDLAEEDAADEEEAMSEDDMQPLSPIDDGFGETLSPADNPKLDDQFDDEALRDETEADYPGGIKPDATDS
ncbi:MAG TPA: hypothetical protein VMT30_01115 [Candidatus Saccharimonadia bacterium]|nr:hypothetical protein [Candidatus Saccharimonadia bacterium]